MKIIKNIINYLKIKNSLIWYDKFWTEPDPKRLDQYLNTFLVNEKNEKKKAYILAIRADVLEDNPEKSIEILINSLIKKDLNDNFIKYRLAYLYSRCGRKKEALQCLDGLNSSKSAIFKICLKKINNSFTMTRTMYEITKKFGVHEQFGSLESLVRKNNFKIGAEIGVFMGFHASHLLEACRNLNLICVDLYGNIKGNGYDDWNDKQFDKLFNKVKKKLSFFNRVVFQRCLSFEAAEKYNNEDLDFIFIDADHRYEAVKKDILTWERIVKSGGIISGHDYDQPDWPGVKQAVSEWSNKTGRKVVVEQGNFWWTIK